MAAVGVACSSGDDPGSSDQAVLTSLPAASAAPTTTSTTTSTTTYTTTTTTATTTTTSTTTTLPPSSEGRLELVEEVWGDIAPKSVVASGTGLFFAQNMMYRHTVTVYDAMGNLLETIDDEVTLADFGIEDMVARWKGR